MNKNKHLDHLNSYRAKHFYFQHEVIELLGVSKQHVKQYLRDRLNPQYMEGIRTPLYDKEHIDRIVADRAESAQVDSRITDPS